MGMGGRCSQAEKIPDWHRGCLAYAATCWAVRGGRSYWCGLVSASGVEGGAGLVTPAMKRSTSLVALSRERQSSSMQTLELERIKSNVQKPPHYQ